MRTQADSGVLFAVTAARPVTGSVNLTTQRRRRSGEAAPAGRAGAFLLQEWCPSLSPSFCSVTAASLMAARMWLQVPQRQMLPDMAESMSASLGVLFFASSAQALAIWPDWQ